MYYKSFLQSCFKSLSYADVFTKQSSTLYRVTCLIEKSSKTFSAVRFVRKSRQTRCARRRRHVCARKADIKPPPPPPHFEPNKMSRLCVIIIYIPSDCHRPLGSRRLLWRTKPTRTVMLLLYILLEPRSLCVTLRTVGVSTVLLNIVKSSRVRLLFNYFVALEFGFHSSVSERLYAKWITVFFPCSSV